MTQDTALLDALTERLESLATPASVRIAEADITGKVNRDIWKEIESSGFGDAMRSEAQGGAGLNLSSAFPLFMLFGRLILTVPLAETMLARAWLDHQAYDVPTGNITFASAQKLPNGDIICNDVTHGRDCDWVLVSIEAASVEAGSVEAPSNFSLLLNRDQASFTPSVFALNACLTWRSEVFTEQPALNYIDSRLHLACIYAAQLAGALTAVFDRTLQFANDRQQFGRPIGKFQAIQHQLSVIAEHVFAARMAAQIGCHAKNSTPDLQKVAIAKARTSEAALEVAALSHSIHGAIGFTSEFDLQLYTRQLHAWRQTAGSESYWHTVLGTALIHSDSLSLDLIRNSTDID
jgi:acyl-CoA dehydrogenase